LTPSPGRFTVAEAARRGLRWAVTGARAGCTSRRAIGHLFVIATAGRGRRVRRHGAQLAVPLHPHGTGRNHVVLGFESDDIQFGGGGLGSRQIADDLGGGALYRNTIDVNSGQELHGPPDGVMTIAHILLLVRVGIPIWVIARSEEHTSELQSPCNL